MWIYLSPHLDDAAYSCGGLLWTQTQAGEEVGVWTLFAGDPPAGRLSPFAEHMHALWEIRDRSFGDRRAEDHRVCAMLGAKYRHFSFRDCIYRRGGPRARFLYPTDKHIFGKLSRADSGLAEELVDEVTRALPPGAQLVCPLGLGNHVDHLLTRLVAERLGRPLLYYEDFPYALQEPGKNDKVLASAWESEIFPLSPAALNTWQAAVAAYVSQLSVCWETESEMREALSRHLDRVGGVRLWRRKKSPRVRDARARDERTKFLLVPHQTVPISPSLPMGGGVASMIDLAESLHRAEVDVTVAAILHEGKNYRHNGVTYHNVGPGEDLDPNYSLLSDRRFDVILAHRGFVIERAARYFPFAVKILRSIDVYSRPHGVPAGAINLRADAVIAVSQFVKSGLVKWGVREEKIEVINDGLRTDVFCRNHDIAREENLIVFAGATIPEKGIFTLLKACNLLMRHEPGLRLEVYGSVGLWKQEKELVDWRKVTSLRPNIVYKGATTKEDLARAFNRASLCVIPSDPNVLREGFPRVSTEAQGCGCPVIVSQSGGLPETLVDGETGVIVDPLTEETLADAIGRLLADRGKRDEMSRKAEQYAKRFTVDDSALAFLNVIEEKRKIAATA